MAIGYQQLTSAGAINTSGKAIKLFGTHVQSKATGPGTASFYDGTSTSGTLVNAITGTTNEWFTPPPFDEGRVFPTGCYVDFDTNTNAVTVWYQTLP